MPQHSPGRKLKRPIEQIRAELIADPDTQAIAKAVRMKVEDYVEMVLDYLQNPDKEPMLGAQEDQAHAAGEEAPSAEELADFLHSDEDEALASGFDQSGFESRAPSTGKPSLLGTPAPTADSAAKPAARPELLDQVRRGSGGGRI